MSVFAIVSFAEEAVHMYVCGSSGAGNRACKGWRKRDGHRKMYLFYCIVKKHKIMNAWMFIFLQFFMVTIIIIKERKTNADRS